MFTACRCPQRCCRLRLTSQVASSLRRDPGSSSRIIRYVSLYTTSQFVAASNTPVSSFSICHHPGVTSTSRCFSFFSSSETVFALSSGHGKCGLCACAEHANIDVILFVIHRSCCNQSNRSSYKRGIILC